MEPISITIQPPITEHCTKCKYDASRSFGSYLVNCPDCGGRSISGGARPQDDKPIRVHANYGSYNFANPHEKQWCYSFYNVPSGKNYSFTCDEELDTSCPIDLAVELKGIFDKYLYTSQKAKARELAELLDTEEEGDRQHRLNAFADKVRLERELYKCLNQNAFIFNEA
ncbi:MAG: hypothetical protein KAR40_11365 [Candidatus Sabulitectum sp.]|nr:hypothetical protein [Candidatus Sabulitectum sp.]